MIRTTMSVLKKEIETDCFIKEQKQLNENLIILTVEYMFFLIGVVFIKLLSSNKESMG